MSRISSTLASISRTGAVELLAVERLNSVGRLLAGCHDDESSLGVWSQFLDHPVNPCLLSTAMAADMLDFEDAGPVIDAYLDGSILTGLESRFIDLDSELDPGRLALLLDLEAEFVEAWGILGLWQLNRPGTQRSPETLARKQWRAFAQQKNSGPEEWFYWQSLWNAWHLANPALYLLSAEKEDDAPLFHYAFRWSANFRTARQALEERISGLHPQIGQQLFLRDRSPIDRDHVLVLRTQSRLLQRQIDRARTLNDWIPSETEARLSNSLLRLQKRRNENTA